MDMNWQTMLHEAANASFEKDIEVRSAADNDAYSCVDLPKAKIRELSEKILHLPHQGIVLLFSRYCFRLSPQETEKFFQMKNAKGRFRFYRELLSTSMGLSSEQVISDASLNRACKIAMKDYLRTELKEDAAVSSTGKSRTHIVFRRFGKAVTFPRKVDRFYFLFDIPVSSFRTIPYSVHFNLLDYNNFLNLKKYFTSLLFFL